MKRQAIILSNLLAMLACINFELVQAQELRGPIPETQGTTALPDKEPGYQAAEQARTGANGMAGLSTSGSDAVMNQDMLLINPNPNANSGSGNGTAKPLTASIGMTITMSVDTNEVVYKNLRGLTVTVVNDTNKPLIIDGDNAVAMQGGKTYKSAPITAVELAVSPIPNFHTAVHDTVTIVLPAAATAGLVPIIKDLRTYSKPTLARYGKDQERRVIEGSRFGKRILWPHEKTQGVIYFETIDAIARAKVEIPVTTMFDNKDAGVISSAP